MEESEIRWRYRKGRITMISMYKRMRPLTHSLTAHGPSDSMEGWVTNFGDGLV